MVMDVVGSYGDWRQPSQQAPASLASTREHTPVSAADVNFNSPGHRSSQDGSFIQDEDMQLILEFGAKAAATPNKSHGSGQNVGVLSESWMHRHAKWATDFDANVAELDFDDFSRRDIRTLRKAAAAFQLGKNVVVDETTDMVWDSFTTTARDATPASVVAVPSADCNHNKIRTAPPCNSLDASLAISAGSLFSSAGGAGNNADLLPEPVEHRTAVLLNNPPPSMPAFISTDSLDMSSMAGQEELIRAACTTKKQDYVLTFDRVGGVSESGVGGSDDTDYQDARLSNAVERSLLNNAGVSESLSTGNGEEEDDSTFITWCRVKRSYETDRQLPYEAYNAKFTSLPNLVSCSSRNGRESMDCMGGGERMLSGNGDQCVPIYELKSSAAPDVSMTESGEDGNVSGGEGAGRFSLLKAFKSKLSGTFERLPLPQFRHGDHSSGDSSGYMTGTGSQHGYGAGAKPKMPPKASVASGDDCELRIRPPSSTASKEEERGSNEEVNAAMVDDYNYAEFFINGRYIDINHNEIGFVPPSTRGVQRASSSSSSQQQQQQFFVGNKHNQEQGDLVTTPPPQLTSFHQQAARAKYGSGNGGGNNGTAGVRAPAKPPRTFATLLRQQQLQEEEDRENANNGYVLQQRPERAPYGRRILPKIPDESQINATEVSRMKDSATQVPVYVVDQSVQTTSTPNSEHSMIVVTTCVTAANQAEPFYVGSGIRPAPTTSASCSKLTDWRKMLFGGPSSATFVNVPDLNFLKFPFSVPQLFPHVPPFPLAFLNDGPDVTSFVAQQAKLINASDDQLAAPRRVLPSPPPQFVSSKQQQQPTFLQQQHPTFAQQQLLPSLPLLAEAKSLDCGSIAAAAAAGSSTPGTRRDSGLGSSGGPSHIQDWESLATLLPKDVLHAYSFFKANSDLLGKSAPLFRPDLNIDKKTLLRGIGCCGCSSGGGGRSSGKRASLKLAPPPQHRSKRLGRKQRPLSEPAFKRKQFESIVEEEDKICDGGSCRCFRNDFRHHHHHHVATWCCGAPSSALPPQRCTKCQNRNWEKSPQKKRSSGHVCVGDTDDTEEEEEAENIDEHEYRPLNRVAEKLGGVYSDDERLMPPVIMRQQQQNRHPICSDDDDDEDDEDEDDEDYYFRRSPFRGTRSEYQVRDTKTTTNSCVPKFCSVQNVKEISQFGYPLKKLRPTQLTCTTSDEAAAARPCATCYRVRSPSQDLTESGSLVIVVEDQNATDGEDLDFCDCRTSDILDELRSKKGWSMSRGKSINGKGDMCRNCEDANAKRSKAKDADNAKRLYQQKRGLVQSVAAACELLMKQLSDCQRSEMWQELSSENAKAASAVIRYSLCPTVERLVADGLLQGKNVWTVALASATLGPATKSIYELVTDLDKSVGDNGEHSLLFVAFLNGLLSLRSLDCWLSYLSLKDKVLSENYNESSFVRKATSTYRTLFDELLRAIQPLSLLPFDQFQLDPSALPPLPIQITVSKTNAIDDDDDDEIILGAGLSSTVSLHKEIVVTFRKPNDDGRENAFSLPANLDSDGGHGDGYGTRYSLIPTRLPSDSRVPKSSSVPSKMLRHASEPPKSRSVDTGLRYGVVADVAAFRAMVDARATAAAAASARPTSIDKTPSLTRPSRIPVLKSSRSCPEGPRQRSLSNRRIMVAAAGETVPCVESMESESAMSVTASTFSEIDAPDTNFYSDSDYRSADARYVYAIDEQQGDRKRNYLAFSKGDTMILLDDKEDGFLRCQRNGEVGLVPRKKVTYVTFL